MARKKKNAVTGADLKLKQKKFEQVAGNIEITPVSKFLKENFLPYAWSYNLDRALNDVTGLKPVQRRILYTMYKEGLTPGSKRSKVASLVGSVLHYHPHGDSSVEDALKNLAREHIFRVPLIDGKGDFGIPGTPGAAGRYIEARLNKAAWLNVQEIGEHATAMMPSYDGSKEEPVKTPVRWPISVINGGAGIAIAYASSMPSHNPSEIMKACKLLVRKPDSTHAALQKIILGPDFNMGGSITSNEGIKQYLETGQGAFKIRGQYTVTPGARSSFRIEFDEIPFGTYPEKIIQEIQKKMEAGHLKEVSSYKDLGDLTHPIRIVIDTKPSSNYKKVLADLFKHTSLESSFSANITTIVNNKPQLSSMKDLLIDFIEFRKQCIFNKTKFSLKKKDERLHMVDGLMKALMDIDSAISIIRKSDDIESAREKLQAKFKIDSIQADYVLSLQLRRLTKMDKLELENERKELIDSITYLQSLMTDEEVLKEYLLKEFDETLKVIGDERKTEVNQMTEEELAAAEKEMANELKADEKDLPCHLTRFADGKLLKSKERFEYTGRTNKLSNTPVKERLSVGTKDSIIVIDSKGTGHKVSMSYLIEDKASDSKALGLDLPKDATVIGVSKLEAGKNEYGVLIGTRKGLAKLVKVEWPNSEEFPVINLDEDDEVIYVEWLTKPVDSLDMVFVSSDGYIARFPVSTLRASGFRSAGVRGMKLRENAQAVTATTVPTGKADGIFVITQGDKTIKMSTLEEVPTKGKGVSGVIIHVFKKDESKLTNAYVGVEPVATLDKFKSVVPLPTIQKRSSKGIDFDFKVLFGTM